MVDLQDKVCIVTGSNTGIGYVSARELARLGAEVVMICRDQEKGEAAQNQIYSETRNPNLVLLIADLSSQESIDIVAESFGKRYDHLDILLNNAGAMFSSRHESPEGFELTFALNHLGYFFLTHLLMNHLKASPSARIINVASRAHEGHTIHFDDLMAKEKYSSFRAYGQSKLANIMFTYALARKLKEQGLTNITANTLHPGLVNSQFARDLPTYIQWVFKYLGHTPRKGAATSVYLAAHPEAEGVTGQYFVNKQPRNSSKVSYDKKLQEKLWKKSLELTGIKDYFHPPTD